MYKILSSLVASALIYLIISVCLALSPIKRVTAEQGLDFSAIDGQQYALKNIVEQHYLARDETSLFYRRIEGSSDLCIVLIHGSGSEGRYLTPLADAINTGSGATVVIPDLRGHGRSQHSSPGDVDYLGQIEHDLEDLLSQIKQSLNCDKVILGGHSSGGGLAVKYNGNDLGKFDGSLLLSPYLGYRAVTVRPNSGGWVQIASLRYAGLAMLNNIGITRLNSQPVLFFNRPPSTADTLQVDHYSYRLNESLSPQHYERNLRSSTLPTLVLVGEDDEAFYPHEFESVFKAYAPSAELQLLTNTKHLDMVFNPFTAELINRWLRKNYKQLKPEA